MTSLLERDYFTDFQILKNPYQWLDAVRQHEPIHQLTGQDIIVVTGFEESLEVLRNTEDFSSVIAPQGPTVPLPFIPEGEDISPQIEANRDKIAGASLLAAYDGHRHSNSRSIINRLFTPSRLKANEEFMTGFADKMVRQAVATGHCEVMNDIATRFVTVVISDLLGVPAHDRETFMEVIAKGPPGGNMTDGADKPLQLGSLEFMARYFVRYVMERRAAPCDDVLSRLSNSTYPDGTLPEVKEIVSLATFLFAAGQDTSAKLLGNSLRYIVDQPGLQQQIRADKKLIPQLIEEVLRLEGSAKATFRIARRKTSIAGKEILPGQRLMVSLAGANRDPRRWQSPNECVLGRERIREHLAFGRGAHVCAGAPLARVEVRVLLEKMFEHTSNISINEQRHGPAGNRNFEFEPSFIIHGLLALHLELTSN